MDLVVARHLLAARRRTPAGCCAPCRIARLQRHRAADQPDAMCWRAVSDRNFWIGPSPSFSRMRDLVGVLHAHDGEVLGQRDQAGALLDRHARSAASLRSDWPTRSGRRPSARRRCGRWSAFPSSRSTLAGAGSPSVVRGRARPKPERADSGILLELIFFFMFRSVSRATRSIHNTFVMGRWFPFTCAPPAALAPARASFWSRSAWSRCRRCDTRTTGDG